MWSDFFRARRAGGDNDDRDQKHADPGEPEQNEQEPAEKKRHNSNSCRSLYRAGGSTKHFDRGFSFLTSVTTRVLVIAV